MKTLLIVVIITVYGTPTEVEMKMNDFSNWSCKQAMAEIIKRDWFVENEKVDIVKMECVDENTADN